MGLFNKIKRMMGGGGGIGAPFTAPSSFTWNDKSVDLQIELAGHKEEPRTISHIDFHLTDELSSGGDNDSSSQQHRVNYTWTHQGPIELAAGESLTLNVTMPLPYESEQGESVIDPEQVGGGFLGKLAGAIKVGPPTDIERYRLTMSVRLADSNAKVNKTRTMRYGGMFKSSVKLGGFKVT